MRRIVVLAVGRLRDPCLRALCDDYYQRCARSLTVLEQEVRDLRALEAAIKPGSKLVALDERGTQLDSRAFALQLGQWMERERSHVVFAIGGPDGLDEQLRNRADLVMSLSKLTLAHRLARVVLAEQLYRAVSILQGTPYHRD